MTKLFEFRVRIRARGHFVMIIIKNIHLVRVVFWTNLRRSFADFKKNVLLTVNKNSKTLLLWLPTLIVGLSTAGS